MKIIGHINIGNDIFQVDKIEEDFSYPAKKGSFLFDSLQNTMVDRVSSSVFGAMDSAEKSLPKQGFHLFRR